MKMNVIRFLIVPWFLFFTIAITAIVMSGTSQQVLTQPSEITIAALIIGSLLCLFANIQTLSKAGIWITHSLPISLKYSSFPWILDSIKAALAAGAFYLVGQVSWMPLMWQAFVIPAVFTVALFFGIRSLLGPILMWSSRLTFSRITAFFVSLPVFALVPITALFLGRTIVTSYLASQPELKVAAVVAPREKPKEAEPIEETEPALNPTIEAKVQTFKELAESKDACPDSTKEIQAALTHNGPEELVYWATKAVKCTDMKMVIGLPKLAKIMVDHPSPKVRASAIMAMPKFGTDNVKQIGYLLVKRINEKEDEQVIEAATIVLSRLGEDERKWATNRLKNLLNSPKAAAIGAKVLVQTLKNETPVQEYISENLPTKNESRERAVAMVCQLPKASRVIAEPYIDNVVATIKTGAEDDPAIQALDCLGQRGFQAIRKEVIEPQQLPKPVAARALAEMDVKNSEALKTAETCVQDQNDQVRKWCSQSLGKMGAPALPKILDLLQSNDPTLKEAGRNALNFFNDPQAREELERVRAENSGWMANKKKLQIAEAISTALVKLKKE